MNEVSSHETPLSRREEAKALFRNAILDAAEHVFAERGFHAARISDVAKHARIGVGTVYNHFEQKEDLLRALLEERTERMVEHLLPHPEDPDGFEERLAARLARMLEYVEHHRSFFLVAADYGLLGKVAAAGEAIECLKAMPQLEKFRRIFRDLMEEGLAAGALTPMDPHRLAWSLGGILRTFIFGVLVEQKETSLAGLAPTIASLFLHGAARRPHPEPTSAEPRSSSPTKRSTARTTSRPRRSPR